MSDTTTIKERKPRTPRKKAEAKPVVESQILPSKDEITEIFASVGNRSNLRSILSQVVTGANVKHDQMNAVAASIVSSMEKQQKTINNHISPEIVSFDVEFNSTTKTVDNVLFSEYVGGKPDGQALNVNIDYFQDLYKKKTDFDIPKRYSKHEFIEYKYNVSNIIQYYTKRFPDVMDLFDVFSDMCLNKSDIGVSVEFSDDFIKQFFLDEFQSQLEQRQQFEDMMQQQAMGISGIDDSVNQYSYGNPLDDTSQEAISAILNLLDSTSGEVVNPSDSSIWRTIGQLPESPDQGASIADQILGDESVEDTTDETTDTTTQKSKGKPKVEGKTIVNLNLYDSNGNKISLTNLPKDFKKSLQSSIFGDDEDQKTIDSYVDDVTTLDPIQKEMQIYDEVFQGVVYQYQMLISKVEKKIRKVFDNKLIKKIKYATSMADIYGYSIIVINKTDPNDIYIFNPLEVRLYKKQKSSLDVDNFIFAKPEPSGDGTTMKLKILNYQYHCYILSLDPMVMMPVPNIVKISWYLYLMDLVEILMIYNDLIKSKSVNLLEIPVFESGPQDQDGGVNAANVMDSLGIMNMMMNSIESKLVLDTDYIQANEGSEDVAMKLLKNVGLSIAYIPKLSPEAEVKATKLQTDDNEYNKLYTMLNEKIFSILKFPLWFRTSTQVMATFKAIPREVVQFAHIIFMSRVNNALSELEAIMEYIVNLHVEEFTVSYYGSENVIPVKLDNVRIKIRSLLGEYLFENQRTETTRTAKIQNVLTFVSAGFELNPHWVCEYVFPEYTVGDILLDAGAALSTKRQEIENAIGAPSTEGQDTADMGTSDIPPAEGDTEMSSETAPTTEKGYHNINWKQVRTSFANALIKMTQPEDESGKPLYLNSIAKKVDAIIRNKTHKFNIKRVNQ